MDAGAWAPRCTARRTKRIGLRRLRQLRPDPAASSLRPVASATLARPQDAAEQGEVTRLLAVPAAVAGVYNHGGNALDEKQVRDFYAAHDKAMLSQDGEALCAMTAPDFEMVVPYRMDSHQKRQTSNREK